MNLVLESFSSIKDFTCHSFRQYSVSAAADDGVTAQQMIDFLAGKVCQCHMTTFLWGDILLINLRENSENFTPAQLGI